MACKVCNKIYVLEDDEFDSDAKPHVCTTCGLSFSLKIQLKRHTLLHANDEPYICVHCSKIPEHDESKSYNLRLVKKTEGYICEICNESFQSKRWLLRHINQEHSYEKEYTCSKCPESFDCSSDLKRHVLTHKPKKDKKVKSNNSSTDEGKHKPSQTSDSKNLACDSCNKTFVYQASLNKHVKLNVCLGQTSKSNIKPKLVKKNFNSSESGGKKHTCNVCGKSFARKSALEGHEMVHVTENFDSADGEDDSEFSDFSANSDDYVDEPKKSRYSKVNIKKSYTCDHCNLVCFSKQTLVKHMNNHKKEDYSVSDDELDQYETVHVNKESIKKSKSAQQGEYRCEICTTLFTSKMKLKKHIILHVKEDSGDHLECQKKPSKSNKDHFCDVCGKAFAEEAILKRHAQTHEQGNFPCDICAKVFISKIKLKKHLISHVKGDQDNDLVEWRKERTKRSKDYFCEVCGKAFAGEACLKRHSLKHADEDPEICEKIQTKKKDLPTYICEFCEQNFTGRRGAYIKHIHSHTPEVCGICDERFVDRQSLREHCKIHIGTEEGKMFVACSQKARDAKNGLGPPEPKTEYIYMVLR